jgi:predicted trehalose synthase
MNETVMCSDGKRYPVGTVLPEGVRPTPEEWTTTKMDALHDFIREWKQKGEVAEWPEIIERLGKEFDRLHAALAAERKREEFDWGHVKREYIRLQKENAKLGTALAAEQRRADDSIRENVRLMNELATLREQLAKMKEIFDPHDLMFPPVKEMNDGTSQYQPV